jgi:hypothetical protein
VGMSRKAVANMARIVGGGRRPALIQRACYNLSYNNYLLT